MSLGQPPYIDPSTLDVPAIYPITVEKYDQMIAAGILAEDDRVQLLSGVIVPMNPIGASHSFVVEVLSEKLAQLVPLRTALRHQQPIRLSATSEPEPDIVVARGVHRDYAQRHPQPTDIILVVEVADTSLELDRTLKARLYAEAGIREYWLVNLMDRQLEIHREPTVDASHGPHYRTHEIIADSGTVSLTIDDQPCGSIAVSAFLP